jgi:hypothetical protein
MSHLDTGSRETLSHEEFVAAYNSGQLTVHANYRLAMRILSTSNLIPMRYRFATGFWICCLALAIPVDLFSWWKWEWNWEVAVPLGLLGLYFLWIPRTKGVQKSASEFVLEHALADKMFYELVPRPDLTVLRIERR